MSELADEQMEKVVEKICRQLDPVAVTFSGGELLLPRSLLFRLMRQAEGTRNHDLA